MFGDVIEFQKQINYWQLSKNNYTPSGFDCSLIFFYNNNTPSGFSILAKKKVNSAQKDMFNIQEQLNTATCVPVIREAVKEWRLNKYKGITDTTRELINFWFYTDHILHIGQNFRYHTAQREAIETLIYIFEVKKMW